MSDGCQELAGLHDLLEAVYEDTLSDAQAAQLQALLKSSYRARREYLRAVNLHGTLYWDLGGEQQSAMLSNTRQPTAMRETCSAVSCGDTLLTVPDGQPPSAPSSSRLPAFFADTIPGTISYFSSGWPAAYLVATVVLGLGLLIGASASVSTPVHIVRQDAPSPSPLAPSPSSQFVGRITGLVDCQWADPNTAAFNSAHVPLGRKYALASGLLEITYDSGAKIILQGPCTYDVDSKTGGFLSVGKLTAKVEKRGERREERDEDAVQSTEYGVRSTEESGTIARHQSEIRNPKSEVSPLSTLHSPLFTVRTPTAVVTDLGTEFGVEVQGSGDTSAHVFRGVVEVRPANDGSSRQGQAVRLTENESARVASNGVEKGQGRLVVEREAVSAKRFVRKLPSRQLPFSVNVLAHYRLGEDDHNALPGQLAIKETANYDRDPVYALQRHGSPNYVSDTAAPGSFMGMNFIAANTDYFSGERMRFRPSDNFIVEAWARPNKVVHTHEIVVYVGHTTGNGYGLIVHDGQWEGMFGGHEFISSGVKCETGKWTHLALVCEQRHARLWINGHPVGNGYYLEEGSLYVPDPFVTIGGNPLQVEYFDGQIDEVRLSQFCGRFKPEMLLLPIVDDDEADDRVQTSSEQ